MGQFALGIRSLLVKATIFVIMAALLAWALDGSLFPKAQTFDHTQNAMNFEGARWHWRVVIGGRHAEPIRWHLMRDEGDGKPKAFFESDYVEVIGPVVGEDGLYVAGRDRNSSKAWTIERIAASGESRSWPMPDRLAATQQLERVEKGLPLQDEATISRQRFRVLDPLAESADE